MTTISAAVIEEPPAIRKTNPEAQLVAELCERLGVSPAEAMRLYYSSSLADKIEANEHGLLFLDASYLADELLRDAGCPN